MRRTTGVYYTLTTSPPTQKSLLSKSGFVGWGTKVVIIDSGLSDSSIQPVDSIDFTDTGIADNYGHGTYVARIVNFFAKGAKIYIAKVGNEKPEQANVIRALKWAMDIGANLVNISCGFEQDRPMGGCREECAVCQAVNFVSNAGIKVIIAAGNSGKEGIPISCPGIVKNAITVGAVEENGLAEYSSKGTSESGKPNILAPGKVEIDGRVCRGTSFAAPIITGVLASTLNKYPDIEKTTLKLYNSANDIGLPIHCQGHGIFDLNRFISEVQNEEVNDCSKGFN